MTKDLERESKHLLPCKPEWYEIEVEGQIHPNWFNWLDGWSITPQPGGNTFLRGPLADQPALHGLFARIRDLNLKILSLKKFEDAQSVGTYNVGSKNDDENH